MASPNIEGTSNPDIVSGGGKAGFGAGFASYTTANQPPYAKGIIYFDLTLNKLVVGGATAYETVTSS
jgi:hypothetical protein